LIGGYLSEPSKHLTVTSWSGWTKNAIDRLICWRLLSSSGIMTRWHCQSHVIKSTSSKLTMVII